MKVSISTGSRLHLGFLDLNGGLARLYGSIGVVLNNPRTTLTIEKWNCLKIQGGNKELIRKLTKKICDHLSIVPSVKIVIKESIPEHSGLGSGTQFALALANGLALLHGVRTNISNLATIMTRGERSGVGIIGYQEGGFIVDGGRRIGDDDKHTAAIPVKLLREDFPEWWNFILILPETSQGLHGETEDILIKNITPPKTLPEKICRLALMKMLPSFMDRDIRRFGEALTDIDKLTGDAFRTVQGGIYKEDISMKIIHELQRQGAYGVGQSSWGPTLYGLVNANYAHAIKAKMKSYLAQNDIKAAVMIGKPRNRGAEIIYQNLDANKCMNQNSGFCYRSFCSKEPLANESGQNIPHTFTG